MTLFLFQRRQLYDEDGLTAPQYPAPVIGTVTFAPEDAFGTPGAQIRTTMQLLQDVKVLLNVNEGNAFVEGELIDPVDLDIATEGLKLSFKGNILTVEFGAGSIQQVDTIGQWVVQLLPPILTTYLETPVWIKQFMFNVADKQYRYGITMGSRSGGWYGTTSEKSAQRIERGVHDAIQLKENETRIVSAMYYYRHAARLSRLDPDRESMIAEVVLNLTKAIEVLASDRRDSIRKMSTALGFSSDEIEKQIIPLVLFRSRLDVAHVATGPLTAAERDVVQAFVQRAISVVNVFILRALDGVRSGAIILEPVSLSLDNEKKKLLSDLAMYLRV